MTVKRLWGHAHGLLGAFWLVTAWLAWDGRYWQVMLGCAVLGVVGICEIVYAHCWLRYIQTMGRPR
jgi:hypothetical protein